MSPPTVDVAADGKKTSKSGRSPLKKKNVIVEHFSRCDKVEVDLSSYEKETESALRKLPAHLQEQADYFDSPDPEQIDGSYSDNENGLHTPEEVASDCDTFFTPQSAVKSIRKKRDRYGSHEIHDEERTPLGSTTCARSAFDRDELEVSFKEMDEVSDRLNRSLMSHLGPQRNTIAVLSHNRVQSVQEELHQNELNNEWNSPQKQRQGFESEYVAERQSLPTKFATGNVVLGNRSLRADRSGLKHIKEDHDTGDDEIMGDEVGEDLDATPTCKKKDISLSKSLGYQLQQSVNSTELADQMEIQLEKVREAGEDAAQLQIKMEQPDTRKKEENIAQHDKSVNLDDVLNSISLHDCSLLDTGCLKDSGRRFRSITSSQESIPKPDNKIVHRREPLTVQTTEIVQRQRSVNKYVVNLAKWYEAERMKINSRNMLSELETERASELLRDAKQRYLARSSLVKSLVDDSMSFTNFNFLMEEMTTLLNDQVRAATEETCNNWAMIRHDLDSTRKTAKDVTRTVGTTMTSHSPRAPVALEPADLNKSAEIRRWSLHEKPNMNGSRRNSQTGAEVQKNQQNNVSAFSDISDESFVLGFNNNMDRMVRMATGKEVEAQLESESPITPRRSDVLPVESYVKEKQHIESQNPEIEVSTIHEQAVEETSAKIFGELSDSRLDESTQDAHMPSEKKEDDLADLSNIEIDETQDDELSLLESPSEPIAEQPLASELNPDLPIESENGYADAENQEHAVQDHHDHILEDLSDELLETQPHSYSEDPTQDVDSEDIVDESANLNTNRSFDLDDGYMGGDSNSKEPRYRLNLSLLESSPEPCEVKEELSDSVCDTPKGTDARLSISFGSPGSSMSPQEKFSTKFVVSPRQTSPLVAATPSNTSLIDDDEDDFLSRPVEFMDNSARRSALSASSRQAFFDFAAKAFADPQWKEDRLNESCYLVWKDKEEHGYVNSVVIISDFERIAVQFKPISAKFGEIRNEWMEDINIQRAQVYCRVRDIAADIWSQSNRRHDVFTSLPKTSKYSRQEPSSISYQGFIDICRKNVDSNDDNGKPPMWSSAYENSSFEKELATRMAKTQWEQMKSDVREISEPLASKLESEISAEVIENMTSEHLKKKRDGWQTSDSQVFEEGETSSKKSSVLDVKKAPFTINDSLDESLL